jgi:hypothetical protein
MQIHEWASPDETSVADYLLGRLDEEAQNSIEAGYLSNDGRHDFIRSVELDLIEAYLGHSLSEADRLAFASHYLASPGNRRQLQLIQTLSGRRKSSRTIPAAWAALAAGILIAALWGWQYQENRTLRRENSILRASRSAPPPPLRTVNPPQQVTLVPGTVRSRGGGVAVAVEPLELLVRFALVPDGVIATGASIRAVLSGADPQAIAVLPAQIDSEGRVVFDCPVGSLASGQYLWNIESGGKRSRSYSFYFERQPQ